MYRQVALDYAQAWHPETVLALPEIGALGYYSRSQVVDTVGLVSPASVAYYPVPMDQVLGDNAVPRALIRDVRPDYVVSLDTFVAGSLMTDPWFESSYQLIDERPTPTLPNYKALLVFRRLE
jgi:hypothetical protein